MTRVLLLGGTGDAMQIARQLDPQDVYSLARLGKVPADLACTVRVGGFGGAEGLARYLHDEDIGLLVDATHPYAVRISANAAAAARVQRVPCWAVRRAPWQPQAGDDWRMVDDWTGIALALAPFSRPLFTLGREPLAHLHEIPPHQFWIVRCLDAQPGTERSRVLDARGPFRRPCHARSARRLSPPGDAGAHRDRARRMLPDHAVDRIHPRAGA